MTAGRPTPLAVIAGQLGLGGSERQLYLLLSTVDRTRWAPHVFASGSLGTWADRLRDDGVPVTLLTGAPMQKALAFRRACRRLGVHGVLSWSSYTNLYAWSLLGLGLPAVGSFRNAGVDDLPRKGRRLWAALSLRAVGTVVCNSAETAVALRARGPRGQDVVHVRNAVELPAQPALSRARWRSELGIADEDVLVVGIGRLTAQKRFDRFVDVVAAARARVPAVRGLVVGPDQDGLGPSLQERSAAAGLPDGALRLLGGTSQARELVCAADVLLLTSDFEGMPNVVLEAMAAGVPVVTTAVNGVGELVTHGREGWVLPLEVGPLAEAVVRLAEDAALRRAAGGLARDRIAAGFDAGSVYGPVWELLEARLAVRSERGRRALDLALGAALAPAALLLVGVGAALVRATSGGPVLHRAVRVGRYGQPFTLLKLRSMRPVDGPGVTGRDDARVTPAGRWLRRTKLDELPQLLNVLRGEMSLVGPRPEDPRYVDPRSADQRVALSARPGMTSPASLVYRREQDLLGGADWEHAYRRHVLPDKLALDARWVRTATVPSAVGVLLRTALLVLHLPTGTPSPVALPRPVTDLTPDRRPTARPLEEAQ